MEKRFINSCEKLQEYIEIVKKYYSDLLCPHPDDVGNEFISKA